MALASCTGAAGGDETIDIAFDPCTPVVLVPAPDTSPEEWQSIEDAISMWDSVTQVGFTLAVPTSGAGFDAPELPIHFEEAALAFRGVYDDESGEVYINRGLSGEPRAVTVAHELGHTLGLVHVDISDRASVMNHGNYRVEPTAEDAQVVAEMWGSCPPTRDASAE